MTLSDNIMIIAGEVSGDLIGSGLVAELKKREPGLNICGIGGDKMKAAGMDLIFHIKDMAFLGFTEVIRHLPFIRNVRRELLKRIEESAISVVILIDYPGFNLNIAGKIKAAGKKVIYYVSPQVWAWGSGRIKKIKKYIDKMIVLFPFEEKYYKDQDVNVALAGHPLADIGSSYQMVPREKFFEEFHLDLNKLLLLLMPGSRVHEIELLFPEMMTAAQLLSKELNLQTVVAASGTMPDSVYRNVQPGGYTIIRDHTYELMKYSAAGIIKSGTSTLEAAYFELPMVIVYKTSRLTYLIGKNLIKVKSIGMANLISGEVIVPELIQGEMNTANL